MAEKLTDYKYKTLIPIRFSDIDSFGHVNNAVYLTYFEIARIGYWKEIINWDWSNTGIILGRSDSSSGRLSVVGSLIFDMAWASCNRRAWRALIPRADMAQ